MVLYSLAKAVLEAFRAANLEIAPALGEQLQDVLVANRENTNVGFFTTLRPRHTRTPIRQPRVLGNVYAKIRGMQNLMTFALFIKDGLIHTLEGASIDEDTSGIDFSTVKFELVSASKPH
jgi:hypothetical protein